MSTRKYSCTVILVAALLALATSACGFLFSCSIASLKSGKLAFILPWSYLDDTL